MTSGQKLPLQSLIREPTANNFAKVKEELEKIAEKIEKRWREGVLHYDTGLKDTDVTSDDVGKDAYLIESEIAALDTMERYGKVNGAQSDRVAAQVVVVLFDCDIVVVGERLLIFRRKFFSEEIKKIFPIRSQSEEAYDKSMRVFMEHGDFSKIGRLNEDGTNTGLKIVHLDGITDPTYQQIETLRKNHPNLSDLEQEVVIRGAKYNFDMLSKWSLEDETKGLGSSQKDALTQLS